MTIHPLSSAPDPVSDPLVQAELTCQILRDLLRKEGILAGSSTGVLIGAVTDLDVDGNDLAYVRQGGTAYVAHLPSALTGPKVPAPNTSKPSQLNVCQ